MSNEVAAWLARAVADATARRLPELEPLLESLSRSLQALRDADRDFHHPAIPFDRDPNPISGPGSPIPDPQSPIPDNDPPA